MGPVNLLAVVLGAVAFFAVGMVWYTVLFGKAWQKASGMTEGKQQGSNMAMIFGLSFLFELLIATMLGHQFAMTDPSDKAKMMIAIGTGAFIMVPAIGINYLYLRKTAAHFFIDAGHFIVGMAAMGTVFVALG
jgi:hypothetical protein